MPFNSKEKKKEYNKKYYENKRSLQVNKNLLNQETTIKECNLKEQPEDDAFTNCIRSFLKVGEKYVSLHSKNSLGFPVFFHIKLIEDEKILITLVNIRFLKCGTGEAIFIPQ